MKLFYFLLVAFSMSSYAQVMTQQNIIQGVMPLDPDSIPLNEIILDRVIFEDDIYSTSRKTELGDQSIISLAARYHVSPLTFARVRFVTDPVESRQTNKSSRFEFVFARTFENFNIQIDMELLTNDTEDDPDSGGTSLGPDLDSDDTFIAFNINPRNNIVFYPFNFRSDVGDEFNSLDVSRINSIEGSPTTSITAVQPTNVSIINKTIPGLEYNYFLGKHNFYVGLGVATYLYPTNADFDIQDSPTPTAWERKETTAYKFGYLLIDGEDSKINFQHLAHNNTQETGALLQSATSLNLFKRLGKSIVEFETTMSVAGERPYNFDITTGWFRDQTPAPFNPVFADTNGEDQDWINQTGYGVSLKYGYNTKVLTPFISLKYLSEHFIYDGDDSAHRLRTNDEALSHGGLTRVGIGAYFYKENMYFRPYLEHQVAKNPVFSNATDLRADRQLSSFTKTNTLLSFEFVYTFDDFSSNQLWWF
jgi:hypothetical protein